MFGLFEPNRPCPTNQIVGSIVVYLRKLIINLLTGLAKVSALMIIYID